MTDALVRRWGRTRGRVLARPIALSAGIVAALVVACTVAALSFLYIRQTTMMRDLTAQQELARERLVQIEEVNRQLVFEIEQAFSLSRVSRWARERLHMVEPTVFHYVPLFDAARP
jgi:cell division protein FtsL